MFKRLKRISDRAEKTIRRTFGAPTPEAQKVELIYTDWKGLKALVDLLNEDPGPCKPLAPVTGQLLIYVEKYDTQARTHPEYAQQSVDLDDLCLELGKLISPANSSSVGAGSIANLVQ
ncbi:hypothetical protein FRC09_011066 [Ceratobasidium sp. 395]|nr:hypothetical protein FRC09_011066 [Ceratobasidium sp. 395]